MLNIKNRAWLVFAVNLSFLVLFSCVTICSNKFQMNNSTSNHM